MKTAVEKGSILVRFDLMRRTQLPDPEQWAEAEPGVSWLQLDDELRLLGRGLAVYPERRATVGGWLAMDGLGVGSFEYGWLHENVLSASVVLPGGELAEVAGEEVRSFVGPGAAGIVVGAGCAPGGLTRMCPSVPPSDPRLSLSAPWRAWSKRACRSGTWPS